MDKIITAKGIAGIAVAVAISLAGFLISDTFICGWISCGLFIFINYIIHLKDQ